MEKHFRDILLDEHWEQIAYLVPGRPTDRGRTDSDNRLFVESILWMARSGSPWRDLPERFGPWNSVYKRFSRWSVRGVWYGICQELAKDAQLNELFIDSTIVRAHQHASGALKKTALSRLVSRAAGLALKSTGSWTE